MPLTVHGTRFGPIELDEAAVIDFPNGLIGLPGRRWALLARAEDSAFAWLQSLDDPELAIPVTNPWRFFSDYEVELSDEEAERIGVAASDQTTVYVTVRAGESLEGFSANLRAPILIAGGCGHQVINQAPASGHGFPLRAPLFTGIATEAA